MPKPSLYQLLKDIHEVTYKLDEKLSERITCVEERVNTVEDWQEGRDITTRTLVGVASFVGGAIVFIADKVWEVLSKKI